MSQVSKHADSDEVSIARAKEEIARTIAHKDGKRNAISSRELAGMVGLKATTVRDVIPEIRCQYRLPIGSCPGGYYVIDDTEDFRETMQGIEDEIQTKKEHQRELAEAWYSE